MKTYLNQKIILGQSFKIETGHINNLVFRRKNWSFYNNQDKTESVTIKYHSENTSNTKLVLDEIPVGYFYNPVDKCYKLPLGSVYLDGNGYLEITFNLTQPAKAPEQTDQQYSELDMILFMEETNYQPFFFNHFKFTDETATIKNAIKIDAFCGLTPTNYKAEYPNKTKQLFTANFKPRSGYENLFTSLNGIPQDVTVTVQGQPTFSDTVEIPSVNSWVIATCIYFPIGELGKEMFKNLSLSEQLMVEYQKDNHLQSLALIKAGLGFSSDYYTNLKDTIL